MEAIPSPTLSEVSWERHKTFGRNQSLSSIKYPLLEVSASTAYHKHRFHPFVFCVIFHWSICYSMVTAFARPKILAVHKMPNRAISSQHLNQEHQYYRSSLLFSFHKESETNGPSSYSKNPRMKFLAHTSSEPPLFDSASHYSKYQPIKVAKKSTYMHSQSFDKLRVDLMRSNLSATIAEEKAKRLEIQLKEMTKRYERAQIALLERIQNNHSKEERNTNSTSQIQTVQLQLGSKMSLPLSSSNRIHAISNEEEASYKSLNGNGFEGLPPFAAALAANAEREEIQRQKRLDSRKKNEIGHVGNRKSFSALLASQNTSATTSCETIAPDSIANSKNGSDLECIPSEVQLSSNFEESKRASLCTTIDSNVCCSQESPVSEENFDSLLETLMNITNNDFLLRNSSKYVNELIQRIQAQCTLLILQKSNLQKQLSQSEYLRKAQAVELKTSLTSERILRGLQADWIRHSSDTRRNMDIQKEEWKKELKLNHENLIKEKCLLEDHLQALKLEKENLMVMLQSQQDILFVIKLFCQLAKSQFFCFLKEGKSKARSIWSYFLSKIWKNIQYGNNLQLNFTPLIDKLKSRRVSSMFWHQVMLIKQQVSRRKYDISKCNNLPNSLANSAVKMSSETSFPIFSDRESLPLLIWKKERQSRLILLELFLEHVIHKKSELEIPNFLQKVSDEHR